MFYIIKQIDTPLVQKISFLITILGSLMILYVSFLLLYGNNPITMVQPFKVITYSTGQGGIVNYETEYCSTREFYSIFNRQLENIETGELWDVPDQLRHITKGCTKEMRSLPVPTKIDFGTYKLHTIVNIKINAIRTEPFDYESESFNIGSYDEK